MMTFNVEIAEQALGAIKAFPEKHDQSTWRCETGMCLAGWIGQLTTEWVTNDWYKDGHSLYHEVVDPDGVSLKDLISPTHLSHYTERVQELVKQGARVTRIAEYARKVLGIDVGTASVLFCARNTAEDLEHMIKALSNGGSIEFLRAPSEYQTCTVVQAGVRAVDAEGNEVYSRRWS